MIGSEILFKIKLRWAFFEPTSFYNSDSKSVGWAGMFLTGFDMINK